MSELDKESRASCPVCKNGANRSKVKHTDCNCYYPCTNFCPKGPAEEDDGLEDSADEDDFGFEDFADEGDENEFVYAAEVQGAIPKK